MKDEMLDKVFGGVQASLLTQKGKSEINDTPVQQTEETEEKKKRLMQQAEGKGYL